MVHSHWLCLGREPQPGRMVSHCTWTGTGTWIGTGKNGYVPIFHILKLFPLVCFNWISVAFKCPVLAPYTTSVNGFCKILVLVPIPVLVPETVSVNTPLEIILNLFGVYLLCTIAMTWDILISQFPSCCEQVGFKELIARLIEIFFNKISDKL